jgi:DNA-directed RNA polymerase subunit RPC12/RpoP
MNFKPALCPSCGGKMQIPDDISTVKCMYCGVEVIVKEAVRLAGRVKEFTKATAIEKVSRPIGDKKVEDFLESRGLSTEWKPLNVKQHRNQTFFIAGVLVTIGLLIAVATSDPALRFTAIFTCLVFAIPFFIFRMAAMNRIKKADEEMSKMKPKVAIIGYEGHCPYCDTKITLKPDVLGENCPACQKRIVLRDSKFYSVDTPVGGLERNV